MLHQAQLSGSWERAKGETLNLIELHEIWSLNVEIWKRTESRKVDGRSIQGFWNRKVLQSYKWLKQKGTSGASLEREGWTSAGRAELAVWQRGLKFLGTGRCQNWPVYQYFGIILGFVTLWAAVKQRRSLVNTNSSVNHGSTSGGEREMAIM